MKYLIYQDWPNTTKNHAGIKYLCLVLSERYPDEFVAMPTPSVSLKKKKSKYKLIQKFHNWQYYRDVAKQKNIAIKEYAGKLHNRLTDTDEIFLMEYMHPEIKQIQLVNELRALGCNNRMIGMAHMPPKFMNENFSDKELRQWVGPVDKIITLGHTLTDYFFRRGVEKEKLFTTFHYVDDYYLVPEVVPHKEFKVFTMGYNYRDNALLYEIVTNSPDIHFVICEGVGHMQEFRLPNVTLLPFIPEDELRYWMSECDVSLNVMYDTIGSNVIVTSLGMGMAMVCSDVGSIHDYCDESNTCFCSTLDDFLKSIKTLRDHPDRLATMRKSAREKAESFCVEKSVAELRKL